MIGFEFHVVLPNSDGMGQIRAVNRALYPDGGAMATLRRLIKDDPLKSPLPMNKSYPAINRDKEFVSRLQS